MSSPALSHAEKDQLLRVLFTATQHTPILSVKLSDPEFGQFANNPLGPNIPCSEELKGRCQHWLFTELRWCFEREKSEQIFSGRTYSYALTLLNIQVDMQIWDKLNAYCQKIMKPYPEEQTVLNNPRSHETDRMVIYKTLRQRLEILLELGELALQPYLYAQKDGLQNIVSDIETLYKKMRLSSSASIDFAFYQSQHERDLNLYFSNANPDLPPIDWIFHLRLNLLRKAQNEMQTILREETSRDENLLQDKLEFSALKFQSFYHLVEKLALAVDHHGNLPGQEKTKKQIALHLHEQLKSAFLASLEKEADLFLIARTLMGALNGAISVIDVEHQSHHQIRSRLFPSQAPFSKELKNILNLFPQFHSLEILMPPLMKVHEKSALEKDTSSASDSVDTIDVIKAREENKPKT